MTTALLICDEPDLLQSEMESAWAKIEEAHERSGIGNLVRPSDLYLPPDEWWERATAVAGADLEHLGIARGDAETVELQSQPSPRFHGSIPAMLEEVKKHVAENRRVMVVAPNMGELERLADFFTEYGSFSPGHAHSWK